LVTFPLAAVCPSDVLLPKKDLSFDGTSSPEPSFSHEICNIQDNSHLLPAIQPLLLGYREPEEEDSTLYTVLDSFIPFLRGSEASVLLSHSL
jgi:hypothetical protein